MSDPRPLRRRRILVVDDNLDIAKAMRLLLEAIGQDVEVANTGPRALELAGAGKPELVFLDLGLPVMDGYDVARALRAQPGGRELRIIAISGWGDEKSRARSAASGVDEHWLKPIALAEIEAFLART